MVSPIQFKYKILISFVLVVIAFLTVAQPALADGIVIPDPPTPGNRFYLGPDRSHQS